MAYLPTFQSSVTVTEPFGQAQTNFGVLLTINTQTLIGQGKMQMNGEDIRFGETAPCLGVFWDYYIESGINTTNTKIWVKIPSMTANQVLSFQMWYGDNSASAGSNFSATFPNAVISGGNNLSYTGGTQTISWLEIEAGDTLFLTTNALLSLKVSKLIVAGVINADGKGHTGSSINTAGQGPGAGGTSTNSGCGGGSYAGVGGTGGYDSGDTPGVGGATYGTISGADIDLGSSGGSGTGVSIGGNGGGAISIQGVDIVVSGSISAKGKVSASDGTGRGGGGGSGGALYIRAYSLSGSGDLSASGGNGATGTSTANDSGGGGGGGRIKIFANDYSGFTGTLSVAGGLGGPFGTAAPGAPGGIGSTHYDNPGLATHTYGTETVPIISNLLTVTPDVGDNTLAHVEIENCNPSFTVYWRRVVAGSAWNSAITAGNLYDITGLLPATAYLAFVTDASGNSSATVYFTTSGTPICGVAPSGLTASVSCNQITASWDASGYSSFTSYIRQVTPALGANNGATGTTTSRTLTVPASAYGQLYEISVAGKCGAQYSVYANPIYITVPDPRPASPANVTFSGISCNAMTINWDASPGAVGYRVRIKNTVSNTVLVNAYTTNLSFTRTGLSSNFTYEVWVTPVGCNNLAGTETPHYNVQTCSGNVMLVTAPRLMEDQTQEYDYQTNSQFFDNETLRFFPNPVQNTVSILGDGGFKENVSFVVNDVMGRMIFMQKSVIQDGIISQEINFSGYPSGVYFISVSDGEKTITEKIIKE